MTLWIFIDLASACSSPEETAVEIAEYVKSLRQASIRPEAARTGLDALSPCVETPSNLAELHRAQALVAFASRDREAALRAWRAARFHDPILEPHPQFDPETHDLWAIHRTAVPTNARMALTPLRRGAWRVDGQPAMEVPADRAYTLAIQDQGTLLYQGYHFTAEEALGLQGIKPARRGGVALGVGAVLTGVGLGLLGWAAADELALSQGTTALSEVEGRARVINQRYAGGGVVTGLGLAVGSIGAILRW